MNLSEDSLTIVKYKLDGEYLFQVFDKLNEPDEPKRLDLAIQFSAGMAELHPDYQELWIKTCPIFPTR